MGTTGLQHNGRETMEVLRNEFEYATDKETTRILDHARVGGVVYLALEVVPKEGERRVCGYAVFVTRGPVWLHYKEVHEDMGPYAYACPTRILNLLTPTTHEHALKWREACRENATTRDAWKPLLKAGKTVRLSKLIPYANGEKFDLVRIESTRPFRALPLRQGETSLYVPMGYKFIGRAVLERYMAGATEVAEAK